MSSSEIILAITSLLGTGGIGALIQYMINHRANKNTHTAVVESSRDRDERIFRRDLLKELDAREIRYQQALDKTDARIATLQTALDAVEQKYRALSTDYTTLTERYATQSHHIQNITALVLDRDYWQKQAKVFGEQVKLLEARICHLETELNRLAQG